MLAIEVEFLTERYVATAYNSRQGGEWPPHPARLFSALAATHFASESPAVDERAALEWLEKQGAPSISASEASRRQVMTVFVPVNDVALTDVDGEAVIVDDARAELESARANGEAKAIKKATTALTKAEERLRGAIERATAVPKATSNAVAGRRVLPEHRGRQPRTFPSVTPAEPRVAFIWRDAEPTPSQRAALDALLGRLTRLGHSSSLVSARLVEDASTPRWWPAKNGEAILRCVQQGQLAALERAWSLHRETEPRVMPARFEAYTQISPEVESRIVQSGFSDDWLVFRRVGGPLLPMVSVAGVARTVRRALMSHSRGDIPELLSGHTSTGSPSQRDHMAVVPLPFVGHSQATGGVLGVALILPRSASSAERAAVYAAVDAWEQEYRVDDEDTPSLRVTLGAAGVLEVERVEWGPMSSTLRSATWSRPSVGWVSATPMALDRNPGDLRSRDLDKQSRALAEASASVRAACERIDLPAPESVEILPAAPLAGAAKARSYPPYPEESSKTRRVLTHVRLQFAMPVRGPILLGAGRYLGLGLFRPEDARG